MSVDSKMTAIADAIREKTGKTEKLNLDDMATGVGDVYNAGFEAGQNSGGGGGDTEAAYSEGFTDGEDAMWDRIQDYGNKKDYRSAFFYCGFQHFDPKYPIAPISTDSMFCGCAKLETVNWEKMDLTRTSSLYSIFAFCSLLKEVDTDLCVANPTGGTLINSVFRNCFALQSVRKITAYPSAVWKQSFENCTALTHVKFAGTIGANGLNLQWSTGLDRESIESIIYALSDSTSGLSITLSEAAVNKAFPPIIDGDENHGNVEWISLIETKQNWTINLV